MVTKSASEPAALRKMLKPLAEKRRRERINRSLEELRLLLLDRTRQQALQSRKAEKAAILELAVRYLRGWSAPPGRGADPVGEGDPLQRCYLLGFRECLLRLSAFIRHAQPCLQGRLLEALQRYLAAKFCPAPEPSPPEPSPLEPSLLEPGCRLQPGPPPAACPSSPLEPCHGPCHQPGDLETPRRQTSEVVASKREPPQPAFWRPWP